MHEEANGATEWRDLSDQLTEDQVGQLERWERQPIVLVDGSSTRLEATVLLSRARELAAANAAAAFFADVAPPPEPGEHFPWESDGDGGWRRFFVGSVRAVTGDIQVTICGQQSDDGTCERSISVDVGDQVTPAEARQLAVALIAAADEIDTRR